MKLLEIGPGNNPILEPHDTLDCYDHYNPTYKVDIVKEEIWPIPDNTYDAVVAIHVLEHIELARVGLTFKNVLRILKPSGRFQVHVPNGIVIMNAYLEKPELRKEVLQQIIYGAESQECTKYDVAHKVLYDIDLLTEQFKKYGFVSVYDVTDLIEDRHDVYWKYLGEGRFSIKVLGFKGE